MRRHNVTHTAARSAEYFGITPSLNSTGSIVIGGTSGTIAASTAW